MRKPKTLYGAVVAALGARPKRVELEFGLTEEGTKTLDRLAWTDEFEGSDDYLTIKKAARSLAALPVGAEVLAHVWVAGAPPSSSDDEYLDSFNVTRTSTGWTVSD